MPYFQVLSIGTMCVISMVQTIAETFFGNFLLNDFGIKESRSGSLLSISAVCYTLATVLSGALGTRNKVQQSARFYL